MARRGTTASAAFGRSAGDALGRGRLGGPAHLRLLLARLAQPRRDRVRRDRRPLVGDLRDDLGPLPPGRAVPLAHDRRAPGPRRSRSARPLRVAATIQLGLARRASRSSALALRDPLQDDLFSGSATLYWILRRARSSPSRPASSPGASSRAAGGSRSRRPAARGVVGADVVRARGRASGSPAAQTAVALGHRRRAAFSPDRGPARLRGRAVAQPDGAEPPPRPARRDPSSPSPAAAAFAAAVLLIMLSEQTLLNAGPLLVRAVRGRRGGGVHLQRADDRPGPAGPLPGRRDQPPPPPHPAALERRGRPTPTRSGSRSASRCGAIAVFAAVVAAGRARSPGRRSCRSRSATSSATTAPGCCS